MTKRATTKRPTKRQKPKNLVHRKRSKPTLIEQRFIVEYLKDMNGTQAAIRAGYKKHNAGPQASRLLSRERVMTAIAEAQAKLLEKRGITVERVLDELARIGFSDPRRLFDERGRLRAVHTLSEEDAATIASIEINALGGAAMKIKRWDKTRALELIGKHLRMFAERNILENPDGSALKGGVVNLYLPDNGRTRAGK